MSAQNFKNLPETIEKTADITKEQLAFLLATEDDAMIQDLKQRARNTGDRIYGKNVYIRGLIEFTNYCKNDCLYCGIRRSNCHADRYRLTEEEILSCCKIGYQTGCGFMVGSPYQTVDTLWEDLQFIRRLKPQMVGIGPFIPQKDTPFGTETAGTMEMTLRLLSIIRLIHPHVLLPATTALGTIHPKGRELGILAGANVVMPNLSPVAVREKYKLYDNKICTGDEAAECRFCMQKRMESIGYQVAVNRGDFQP